VRIAVIQMVSSQHVATSLRQLTELTQDLATSNVDAIFLPENFAALGHQNPAEIAKQESPGQGPIQDYLRELCTSTNSWVFAGTMPLGYRADTSVLQDGRVRASSLVFDANGMIQSRYDKIHMFDVDVDDAHRHYRESDTFEHGDEVVSVPTPWGEIGLSVCYDLRFSELYLTLAKRGVVMMTAPSAFTVPTGKAHFETLMRARAIESFVFMVAACQGGSHDSGRETYGHSMVVNPWGEIIAEAATGEDVLIVDIDFAEVAAARSSLPVLQQRRL
jgi:predicted amidohydrolase